MLPSLFSTPRIEYVIKDKRVNDCDQLNRTPDSSSLLDSHGFVEAPHILSVNKSLHQLIDDLSADDMLHFHVATQLAEKVVILRRRLQQCESELEVLRASGNTYAPNDESNNFGNLGGGNSGFCFGKDACFDGPEKNTYEFLGQKNCSFLAEGRTVASDVNTGDLQAKLIEMDVKNSLWKQRVKEALKSCKKREQSLVSENIALRQEIYELRKRLSGAGLPAKESSLKQTLASDGFDTKSWASQFPPNAGDQKKAHDENELQETEVYGVYDVPLALPPPPPPQQQQQQPLGDDRCCAKEHARLPSYVVAAYESLAEATAASATAGRKEFTSELQPEVVLGSCENRSKICFPYPPPSFVLTPSKEKANGEIFPVELHSYARDGDFQARSFIVSVHSSNGEMWVLQTKQLVEPGMTVAQLKQRCCAQLYERCKIEVDPDEMCIRYYHKKAQRHVVLSCYRELHSFLIFQRCEREQIPIVLYLAPRDRLSNFVHETMSIAAVPRANALLNCIC